MTQPVKKSPLSNLGLAIWSIAALFFLYEFFLRTFVGSIAHQVIPDLKLNAETFAIIGSAYYIAYGIMQIPVGILADKFGVKWIMLFATLVCAIATFLFAQASGFSTALISRLLMGLGSSFAFVCLLVIAITWFPKKFFGFFAGLSQFIGTMGPLLAGGPLIAWIARSHSDWRTALHQTGILGIILAVLVLLIVKNKPRDATKTLIFLTPDTSITESLRKLIRNKQAWLVASYSASIYVSMALLGAVWGTEYLQVQGLSQQISASIISLAWLGYAIGCLLLGALSDIVRRRKPTLIFCALIGLLSTSAITYMPLHHHHWVYAPLFFLLGVAASGQNVGFATMSEQVDVSTRATGMGLNNGSIILFAALVPPLASFFIYLSAGAHSTQLTPSNFIGGFSIMPISYLIASTIAYFFIEETYCKPQKETIKLQPS